MDLIRVFEAEENGHKGIMVVYDDVGLSWNLAEEAARKLGKELLDQHPRAIRRDEKIHRFFEFKP